ncbi:HNH endonuclease [Synechocystis sp. LKSZ1]|uniref:HNH endonuclease n=1 Tax=Synechocystis sp. LKSZ1 TaxID=3144951 RepID=UPI00336C2912
MSKKIDYILEVLKVIRDEYLSNDMQSIENIRINATTIVAQKYGLWRTTILDKYQRGLRPETYGTESFDNLVKDWLIDRTPLLQEILLKHSTDEADKRKVARFFHEPNLTSFDKVDDTNNRSLYEKIRDLIELIENTEDNENNSFDPSSIKDERTKTAVMLVQRRGQKKFREELISLYDGKCAISGTNTIEVLEASHIVPYFGDETNHPTNGILLRSDIHNLFDFGLIAINETTYSIMISEMLRGSYYQQYDGRQLYLPKTAGFRPSRKALQRHRETSQFILDNRYHA